MKFLRSPLALFVAILAVVLFITLRPYVGNITALFHMDVPVAEQGALPHPFIVLDMPGYDGMHYYRIAQHIPMLFSAEGWHTLSQDRTVAYAYQRFLLPLFAFTLSFGIPALLPWSFFLIQLASLIGLVGVLLRSNIKPLYAFAIGLSPAAMVGLHFSLAEPLTLLLVTLFLLRYTRYSIIGWQEVLLLALLMLAREINIFLALFILIWSALKRDHARWWLLCIPPLVFLAWHGTLYAIFHQVPFLWSTDKHAAPFTAILQILLVPSGYNMYTGSSIALFLLFVVPAGIALLIDGFRSLHRADVLLVGSLFFLAIMSVMPDHIWGSITSIGRVITPVYPFAMLYAARRNDRMGQWMACVVIGLGLGIGIGLGLIAHPFHVA